MEHNDDIQIRIAKPFTRKRQTTDTSQLTARQTTLSFRINEQERLLIEQKAAACNLPVSSYIRKVAIDSAPRQALTDDERSLMLQVKNVTGDLQQMRNLFHKRMFMETLTLLDKVLQELRLILHIQ